MEDGAEGEGEGEGEGLEKNFWNFWQLRTEEKGQLKLLLRGREG